MATNYPASLDSLVTYKYLTGSDMSTFITSGTVTIEYNFTYEAA